MTLKRHPITYCLTNVLSQFWACLQFENLSVCLYNSLLHEIHQNAQYENRPYFSGSDTQTTSLDAKTRCWEGIQACVYPTNDSDGCSLLLFLRIKNHQHSSHQKFDAYMQSAHCHCLGQCVNISDSLTALHVSGHGFRHFCHICNNMSGHGFRHFCHILHDVSGHAFPAEILKHTKTNTEEFHTPMHAPKNYPHIHKHKNYTWICVYVYTTSKVHNFKLLARGGPV